MSALFKRPSVGDAEMSRIQRDVTSIDRDIRYLSTRLPQETMRDVAAPDGPPGATVPAVGWMALWPFRGGRRPAPRGGRGGDGARLPELLSGSVEATRQVALERRVARHRALVLAAFALMWLMWLMVRMGTGH